VVQVLPGPNSTELAIHIGQARAGWRGGVIAGLCFVLPGVVMVWLLATVAAAPAVRPVVVSVLWWLTPVVVAVLIDALWKFSSQAWHRPNAPLVMGVTTVAAFAMPSEFAVLGAGALAALVCGLSGDRGGGTARRAGAVGLCVIAGATAALAQVIVPRITAAPGISTEFFYFLRAGASVFGSGYVLLAYLQRDLVDSRHWLSLDALTQASALAQITPGPLFATATAAGYAIGGHAGALAATAGIFMPAFLSVTVSAPLRRLVQRSPMVRAALDGLVVASVTLLGRAIVGFALSLGSWQWTMCLVAALALFVKRANATLLLIGAVFAGIVAAVFHFLPS
jgi:chromate transporter